MKLFAGIVIRIRDTPKIFSWIYDVSVLKHSMQGILHAAYGYKRSTLPCPSVSSNLCILFFFFLLLLLTKMLNVENTPKRFDR